MPPDTVRLWEDGYADRYYEQKFKVAASDIKFRNRVAESYVEGLAWVLKYYFQGCPSWTWYYPYHYAPFAADFVDLKNFKISHELFKSVPVDMMFRYNFVPLEQLDAGRLAIAVSDPSKLMMLDRSARVRPGSC